jgi:hypothetical protein
MINLFVSYEIALLAKEKGFNEECFGYYNENNKEVYLWNDNEIRKERTNSWFINLEGECPKMNKGGCTAPLYQQLLDWFREKYVIDVNIHLNMKNEYSAHIYKRFHSINEEKDFKDFIVPNGPDYYKVLIKGIEEAFKLI